MANRTTVVPVKLQDGTRLRVEAVTTGTAEQPVRGGKLFEDFEEGVASSIQSVAGVLASAMTAARPDKATVELHFDIAVEAGALTALLTKGGGSASITVTLEWEPGEDR